MLHNRQIYLSRLPSLFAVEHHYTNTKLISIQTLKPSHFRPPHKNQTNCDPYTEIKLSSIPLNWNQVNFDAHTKTKRFAARIQNPSQLRLPTQKPSQSITTLKNKSISARRVNFDRPNKKKKSDPNAKTKSNSIPHTKIIFRRHHWNQDNSIPTLKESQFRCPDIKTKLISIQTQKSSIFRPQHKNQVNSDPCNEIKSTSTTHTTKSISFLHWNQVKFDPPDWKSSQVRSPGLKIK